MPVRPAALLPLIALVLVTADRAHAQTVRFEAQATAGLSWYKGNTHTHTLESDGDSPPEYVVRWYRDHGYDFLVLTDHNVFTDPAKLTHLVDSTFLLIPGEELTSSFERAPVHVNGLGLPGLVEPRSAESLLATVQANVDAVREVDGVPHINHPNFGWAIPQEILAQVRNDRLLEIHNGHPTVHNHGGDDRPGLEEIWDYLLTNGKRIYGIAVDDAHHFQGEFAADRANPGRAWVVVKASSLDAREILENLERGWFYASTGPVLADVQAEGSTLSVRIAPQGNFRYTTVFTGEGGRELARVGGESPTYRLKGDETYVRATVIDSGGRTAWVQPVWVER